MILEAIFSLVGLLIKFVFNLLPNLPNIPNEVTTVVSDYIGMITSNLRFISFFLDVNYVKTLLHIMVTMIGFRYTYRFIMWIYHKLPLSSE